MDQLRDEILEFSQKLDLFGRHPALAAALAAGQIEEAAAVVQAAMIDAEEMTRPDRTLIRRNVHLKNYEGLQKLHEMIAQHREATRK